MFTRIIVILAVVVFVGCSLSVENAAPSDGHASAKRHIANGKCSSELMNHDIWGLERGGYSKEYIEKFAIAYKWTCDNHLEKMLRRREACKAGTALSPCS